MPQSEAVIREKIGGECEVIVSLALLCKKAVESAIDLCSDDEGWAGRAGGYLCIADGKNGLPLLTVLIGEVSLQKAPKYLEFCQEKAARLAGHPNHQTSWESRNTKKDQWGGAVRFEDKILSFSGLPEMGDEAAMLVAIAKHGDEARAAARRIAKLTDNPYWKPFRGQ